MAEEHGALITDGGLLSTLTWLVVLIPIITGVFLILLRAFEIKRSKDSGDEFKFSENLTGSIGVAGLAGSLILSITVAIRYFGDYSHGGDHPFWDSVVSEYTMIPNGNTPFKYGVMLDPLSVIMMVALAIIAFFIHFYATEYMHADTAYTRFFGTLNFFTGSMFGFVLASNLFSAFIFWELLGFSSYLLIGYYWPKRSASAAGKKAFLYNKVGDVAFMIGIALVWKETLAAGAPTLDYYNLKAMVLGYEGYAVAGFSMENLILPALLIFGGAIGKSAQVPLLGWLPEAMEGPTPVSALLHSSTMVKAGLFLTARVFFSFYELEGLEVLATDPTYTATVIAYIGTLTALAGGLMALTATDIKRVLAFSTISQLGYIGLALGAGGITASFFHLLSHATFKSLLFLCAGAVIHSVHSQEMEDMGGLKKYMPYTYWTMFIGLFGLSGFPLSNGFWSKDAIFYALEQSDIPGHQVLYFLAVFTAAITAFYSTKLLIKIFHGEPRYDKDHVHPSPTGVRMRIPLVGLASLVVIESLWFGVGFLFQLDGWGNFEHELALALGGELLNPLKPGDSAFFTGAGISMIAVFAGIGLAYLIYGMGNDLNTKSFWTPFAKASKNRFGMDMFLYWFAETPVMRIGDGLQSIDKDIIDGIIIDGVVTAGSWTVAAGSDNFDQGVIDGVVNGLGDFTRELGAQFRQLQSGLAPWYARMMAASVAVFLLAFNLAFWTGNL